MSKKHSIHEETAVLNENPYPFSVNENHRTCTREFKELLSSFGRDKFMGCGMRHSQKGGLSL